MVGLTLSDSGFLTVAVSGSGSVFLGASGSDEGPSANQGSLSDTRACVSSLRFGGPGLPLLAWSWYEVVIPEGGDGRGGSWAQP